MWHQAIAVLALCQVLNPLPVQAAATWPSSYDEMEDLMMLQSGYRARQFARAVTPCSFSPVPGFRVAAGFLRTAFHDMAAADPASGVGGLDGSIGYELEGDYKVHNNGPAFNATITYMSQFYNSKASVSDLIALGVYASVRSCGGPLIPIKTGRKDASQAGANSLPDVRDSKEFLIARFAKLGFSPQEMVQLVACGHSLGGVHRANNPPVLANSSAPSNAKTFDSTDAAFDNKIATEYVSGTTKNPLVVGPAESNSDARVFQVDNNVTIKAMTNPDTYNALCANVLQRMIEVVPGNVQLSSAIEAYDAKPGQLNLNVIENGASLAFSGEIRIRTTQVSKSNIAKVQLVYKDRTGGSSCGDCLIATTEAGDASGFDNSFTFYGFSAKLSSKSSISSFNVLVTLTSGQTQTFDNNGKGFPVQDSVFVQVSSSSLGGSSGGNQALKVVAAVRDGSNGTPQMSLSLVQAQAYNSLPKVSSVPVSMSKLCGDGTYTYYSASYDVPASQAASAKVDVSLGGQVDGFRSINFPSSGAAPQCGGNNSTSTSTTTTVSSSSATTTTSPISSSTSSSLTSTTSLRYSNSTTTTAGSISFTLPFASTTTSSTLSSTTISGISTSRSSYLSSTTVSSSSSTSSYIPNPWTDWDPVGPTGGDPQPVPGPGTSDVGVTITTVTTNTVTTFCPSPTIITHKDQTYTVTSATTLTLTWSEPTTIAPANPNNNSPAGPGTGPVQNAEDALAKVSAIYVDQQNEPAPSDGTNGGNKNPEGLDLNISVTITSVEVPTSTPTADVSGMGAWTVTGIEAGTGSVGTDVPAAPTSGSAPVSASGAGSPPPPSQTTGHNGIATFTGAADTLNIKGSTNIGIIAALFGIIMAAL